MSDQQTQQAETISLTELHQAVGDTVSRCHYRRVPIVVTKRGHPVIALVPIIGTLDENTNLRELVAETLGLKYPETEGAGEEKSAEG